MRPSLAMSLVVVLCLGVASFGLVAPAATQADEEGGEANVTQTIEIHVDEAGDAEFRVVTTIDAESGPERAAFDAVATEFTRGQFEERSLWQVVTAVEKDIDAETDREMRLEGPRRDTEYDEEEGVGRLLLIFQWQGFARSTEERLEIRDAWTRDGEPWLRSLGDRQSLELHAPEEYDVEDAQPDSFRDQALVWEGPRSVQAGDLSVTYTRSSAVSPLLTGVGIALLVVLVVGGLLIFRRARGETAPESPPAETPSAADGSTAESKAATADGASSETAANGTGADASTGDPVTDDGGAAAGSDPDSASEGEPAGATATGESEDVADVDPELLSDEERVERLLHENGGRMKQANIVKETGWSNAKVSQLLSKMDEEDRIDKLRLGRENLIALPEEDVTELE